MQLELETERLRITPISEDDVDITTEIFTDPVVTEYAMDTMSEAAVRREMPTWTRRGAEGYLGVWLIADRESGEKYGTVALLPLPVEEEDTDWGLVRPGFVPDADIEVGYFLKRPVWGRGYATEACRRILEFAFTDAPLVEVIACIDDDNDASRNVLEKAGFVYQGRRTAYAEDVPWFRVTREQFAAQPG